ncbi:MAG TPA: NDMA-dependent alcohol dehydrogenase [Blastococcus sp.]|nr:NDMA-dependent alcohol dehydrogenase [Blastococcus sp.]
MSITTHAAIARGPHIGWELTDLQLDEPKAHEVRVKFKASGLCHSDDHITQGDAPVRFPIVGGHEGAGIIESVGPDVRRVKVGDRVVCSYIPACGACRPCSTGHQNMCVQGLNAGTGMFLDGTFRFHLGDEDLGGFCSLGTFSQYAVVSEWAVVPLADDIPWEVASLVGCGVPTGWGSAVYAAGVRAGDTVVIFGAGGVGSNAVQGARYAGAKNVIVIDPVDFKREMATVFGATHTFASAKEAHEFVVETTWGQLADHAILTPGVVTEEMVNAAVQMTGKGGKVTITAVGHLNEKAVHFHAGMLIGYQRQVRGALFGDCNPLSDIPKLLGLYRAGDLKLDELVTRTYALDEVNEAYADLDAGKNLRGVIVHED